MLSDESNKQHIREAIVAMERNNQNNYWEALGKGGMPGYVNFAHPPRSGQLPLT